MKADETKMLLMPNDVCKMLGITRNTLQSWRNQRKGPPFIRLTEKNIRYTRADVERWIVEKTVTDGE